MKKKILGLSLLPVFCLASCNEALNPVGVYSFMLGKQSESHVGISFTLTDEDHVVHSSEGDKIDGKNFVASIDTGGMLKFDLEDLGLPLPTDFDINKANEVIAKFIDDTLHDLKGFYTVSDDKRDAGYKLNLGATVNFPENIVEAIQAFIPEFPSSWDIGPSVLQYVFNAYINEKTMTLQIPASIDDLLYELCWNGIYINKDDPTKRYLYFLDDARLPGEKDDYKRAGTHPAIKYNEDATIKESEIDIMNANFEREFSNTPVYVGDKVVGKISEKSRVVTQADGTQITQYDHYFHLIDDKKEDGSYEWFPSSSIFNAVIYTKNQLFGTFSEELDVKIDVNLENLKTAGNCVTNGPLYASDGGTHKENDSVPRSSYMQKPFVFRDYNDIKIGLTKE